MALTLEARPIKFTNDRFHSYRKNKVDSLINYKKWMLCNLNLDIALAIS